MALSRLTLEEVRSSNVSLVQQNRTIVAVFTGGTGGIGKYTVHALAMHCVKNNSKARIYVVGRNESAADAIHNQYKSTPEINFHFIKANDLSLLRDVDKCCQKIKEIETQCIDLLVMTHADLCFGGRRSTSEGLEKSMSLFYYSRIRIAEQLMPLLSKSTSLEAARVVSVYAAGLENPRKKFFRDDLTLIKDNHYSYPTMRNHATILKTLAFEELARQHSDVSFIHVFPSLVLTDGYKTNLSPAWLRNVWVVAKPLVKLLVAIPSEESGQRTLGLTSHKQFGRTEGDGIAVSTDGHVGGGAYSCKYDGQINKLDGYAELRDGGFAHAAWQHTLDVFKSVEEKGRYQEYSLHAASC